MTADTPQTAAGRALLAEWGPTDDPEYPQVGTYIDYRAQFLEGVLAIEREARSGLDAGLREAATVVAATAEPDEGFEGEFVDYLVPADAIHGLRAVLALASSGEAAPVDDFATWPLYEHRDHPRCVCSACIAREEADDDRS
jgi:hypothetical protein